MNIYLSNNSSQHRLIKQQPKRRARAKKIANRVAINIEIFINQPPLKYILATEENLTYFPPKEGKVEKFILQNQNGQFSNTLKNKDIFINGDLNHKK